MVLNKEKKNSSKQQQRRQRNQLHNTSGAVGKNKMAHNAMRRSQKTEFELGS